MAIEFVCPNCAGTLQVGDDAAGRVIRCGGCLTMLRVPGAEAPPPGGSAPSSPASPFDETPPPRRVQPTAAPADEPLPDERRRRRRDREDDYEDYDRPRRPRGEPPPAPGRGVFIWLVAVGALFFLGLLGCCGGLFLALPKEEWHTHESKAGGFKVDLPAKLQPNIEEAAGIKLDKGSHAEGAVYLRRAEHFMVIYRDIPSTKQRAAVGKTDEAELDEAVEKLLNATEVKGRPREEPITVNGFPGRELTYQGKGGANYTARVVVADTRRYIVLAGGPQPHDSPNVRKFIKSFTITEPKLVDEAKKREKEAADAKKDKNDRPDGP
jgi:hypothetical protein